MITFNAVIKGCILLCLLPLSMIDFTLMLWVKLLVIDRIQPRSNEFATGVENKATGDLKVSNGPEHVD